jgi:nitrogenase molybdenum-iron protein NifN
LLVTHSHGRQAAERLKIPFHRLGIPMFDRIGANHKLSVGYRGGRELIFAVANLLIADREDNHQVTPDTFYDSRREWGRDSGAAIATVQAH